MSEWNKFLQDIKKAEKELGNPEYIWYRGHCDTGWTLSPGLYRKESWHTKERELFIEFKKTASMLFENRTNDWEVLFDMQHYGVPTRLLDWTTALGVAVAFVLYSDYDDSKDSAVYVLDPVALNRKDEKDSIINIPESKVLDYKKNYLDNQPTKIQVPLAIRPSFQNNRITAQKGVFTIQGAYDCPFEVKAESCFKKVVLKSEAKAEAREFLKWANLDEYTIFPDIVGMSRHIKRKILEDV